MMKKILMVGLSILFSVQAFASTTDYECKLVESISQKVLLTGTALISRGDIKANGRYWLYLSNHMGLPSTGRS